VDVGRPKRYRPEPPASLIARITETQGRALDALSTALAELSVPPSTTFVELTSARGTIQLLAHEIARAKTMVALVAPADAYPLLTPALRKAAGSGVRLRLASTRPVELAFASVGVIPQIDWPGEPILFVADARGAIIGARSGDSVEGHWGTDSIVVAAANRLIGGLLAQS
jgi:sugar-specific transcriptional regulator TrmB